MSNTDLISVIMSVYNEPVEWLKESIESILNQTYKNIEFIIVLDNPLNKDALRLIKQYEIKDYRVKLIVNDTNKGLVYSLNRALEYCKGRYIARMDADDISHHDRLKKQLYYIKEKKLDLIGTNVNLFNQKGIFYTTNKLLTHKYLVKILAKGTIGIVHPTFFFKKEVFEKLDGYSKLALHTEDKDFLARAICNGFMVGNIKDILLDCRYNEKSITKNNAIYIDTIGTYISDVFRKCISSKKEYLIDKNFIQSLEFNNEDIINFNKKQKALGRAREAIKLKNYFLFVIEIVKANLYSNSTISSIKVNLWIKFYRVMESF